MACDSWPCDDRNEDMLRCARPLALMFGILFPIALVFTFSVGLQVVVGTHPMPLNYIGAHEKAGDWDRDNSREFLKNVTGGPETTRKYDSTNLNFLKER